MKDVTVSANQVFSSRTEVGTVGATGGDYSPHLHICIGTAVTINAQARTYLDPLVFIPFG